jgi:uncharacterized membrane protein
MEFKQALEMAGTGFELVGVGVLVIGAALSLGVYVAALIRRKSASAAYQNLRRNLGKAILIGLELLIAADIIRSVAIDPTLLSIGVLGLIVFVRTFLSWSLEVEINGEWPWQRYRSHKGLPADPDEL